MNKSIAPYGSWQSPITTSLLTSAGTSLSEVEVSGSSVYWLEARPEESGRVVIVRSDNNNPHIDLLPVPFNARSRVHEYGGGALTVAGTTVYFSNFTDQALYRLDPGREPLRITPLNGTAAAVRFADACVTPDGSTLICVRERHRDGAEAVNDLVAIPSDCSSEPRSIVSGADFYSFPRISPDGKHLAWTSWNHPQMPWDGSELWLADLRPDGQVTNAYLVAGGKSESIFQPAWSPDGRLHFVSDRTGWWNLYVFDDGAVRPLAKMEAEFGLPQWVFNLSTYAFLSGGRIACIYSRGGLDYLGVIHPNSGSVEPIEILYDAFAYLRSDHADRLYFVAASSSIAPEVVGLDVARHQIHVLRRSLDVHIDPEDLSSPEPIEFPTERGLTAFALFYRPKNREFTGPPDQHPPLLVMSHGGPTTASNSALNLKLQFWTSRGFAVVDVNYGGSSGYGRAYRERLNGLWGVVDMEDCINAARYLASRGQVDSKRMAIRGGSAGGYTTLCALVFSDVFAAGASYYGVADLKTLATDTHKFESRYLDGMVGPYPEAAKIYQERSPVHFADRLSCPVILLQGLDDKVVPPSQAEAMLDALRKKNLPFAYVAFAGEGHGFRKAENIRRSAEAELYFYSRIFDFTPADAIEPVVIENLLP